MSDTADSSEGLASRPNGQPPDTAPALGRSPKPRRGWGWLWLLLLLSLAVLSAGAWYRYFRVPVNATNTSGDSVAPLLAAPEDSEVATLRRNLDDAARVNRALREQVLGLTQRVGLVEDGLASAERGAAPGVDAVRLVEADFLLRLGEERLRLFGDVAGARDAFLLADEQLSQVSDPRATSVRQTLALERDALAAIAVADLPVILGRLDGLARGVEAWPLRGRADSASISGGAQAPGWWSRFATAIDRYFRVRRIDPAEHASGGPLLRERIHLDLSRARLLLLRGQGAAALAAIEATRATISAEFSTSDEGVKQALEILDELRRAPLAPQLPDLGESRRELARLRGIAAAPIAAPMSAPGAAASIADEPVPNPAAPSLMDAPSAPAELPDPEGVPAVPTGPTDDAGDAPPTGGGSAEPPPQEQGV
ncbi:MAG TPA: uroporphyrinogen-III C-methyltransferase [Xanthomonadales bacterium]|nr:uroporphyrinogen-III C-methyltransferase [Xanthomonadales bacterium]